MTGRFTQMTKDDICDLGEQLFITDQQLQALARMNAVISARIRAAEPNTGVRSEWAAIGHELDWTSRGPASWHQTALLSWALFFWTSRAEADFLDLEQQAALREASRMLAAILTPEQQAYEYVMHGKPVRIQVNAAA